MPALLSPLVPFLALVLAAAAVHKLIARDRVAAAAAGLIGVPLRLGLPLSITAAMVEGLAAASILIPVTRPAGALAATALWCLYATLLLAKTRHGTEPFDCGCSFGRARRGAGQRFAAVQPLLLAGLALVVAMRASQKFEIEPVFAALAFFGLYLAAGELAALPASRRSLAR